MRIEARAPTRIDLAGGTLDIWPLYLFHPGAVTVNCAVTRRASCVLETRPGHAIELVSRDTGRRERFASLDALARSHRYRLPLVAHLVRHFRPQGGLRAETNSEAPAGAGLGGSSAMAVALCAALNLFGGFLAKTLAIPVVYLDTAGTFVAGPGAGPRGGRRGRGGARRRPARPGPVRSLTGLPRGRFARPSRRRAG